MRPEWAVKPFAESQEVKYGMAAEGDVSYGNKPLPLERIKMVMTRNKDDEQELYDLLGTEEERKNLDVQFKNTQSNFKIAIVVDMWITGFDVPCLDTMYIDKPLQQALCKRMRSLRLPQRHKYAIMSLRFSQFDC